MKNKYLALAVDLLGGPTKTAIKVEASTSAVHHWLTQGGVAKKSTAIQLCKLSGVDFKLLLRGGA